MYFIGKKFIQGQREPIHFLGFSLRGRRALKYFTRAPSHHHWKVISGLGHFIHCFEKPYAVKMDNAFAFFSPPSKERFLSQVVLFLLLHHIIPVFTAPRKPWNQASIEGANSIFSRKFWNRCHFQSVTEIDGRLTDFNCDYQRFLNYQRPGMAQENQKFSYCVYFIRKVYQQTSAHQGYVKIGSKSVLLDPEYINLFT